MMRTAVLASGSGTNLQAIIDAAQAPDWPAPLALVLSDVPGCGALDRAAAAGIRTETVTWADAGKDREVFTERIVEVLRTHEIELVVLAGFMRILTGSAVRAFPGRILNTHPALLPSFRGAHAIEDALAFGVKVTGVTIHIVVEDVDAGPIIAQEAIAIEDSESIDSVRGRIQAVEHRLFPQVIADWARGVYAIDGDRVRRVAPAEI